MSFRFTETDLLRMLQLCVHICLQKCAVGGFFGSHDYYMGKAGLGVFVFGSGDFRQLRTDAVIDCHFITPFGKRYLLKLYSPGGKKQVTLRAAEGKMERNFCGLRIRE